MFQKLIVATLILSLGLAVNGQDDMNIFNQLIGSLISQWGELSADDYQELFNNFQSQGLNHIWHNLNDHCSSNFECGPGACCFKPQITGKRRAVTDGSLIHFATYCAPLRQNGQTCSNHDNSQHYFTFQCPCESGLKCVPGKIIQIHPLISIQADATCQRV